MKTIRCFLAVKLDIETVRSIADVQRDLKDRCDEAEIKVRWVPPPNIHATIRFLGQITEPMVRAIYGMLEQVTQRVQSFEIESAGLGAFPSMEKPRVVWAGLRSGAEDLTELYEKVSKRLIEAGFNFEERPFQSHVTIGRIKDGDVNDFSSCIGDADPFFGKTWVRNLYCYRSDLSPKGAEYHTMWSLPLAGSGYRRERRHRPPEPPPRSAETESAIEETSPDEGQKGDALHDDSAE
ncbi:MAG: RNA 2',3'-cyclic phosphodiesterase [Deltaproteobacteria bacterium]|nr:RNA 2',3'-cyclic phosphodiesterase [Deltaproteobacteria bacterium]